MPVCRYDRRKSLNNVADRRRHGRLLDPEEFADANQSIGELLLATAADHVLLLPDFPAAASINAKAQSTVYVMHT